MESIAVTVSVWVLPVLLAITFHEAAHGWVAWRLGDPTAKQQDRVTFNPLAHIVYEAIDPARPATIAPTVVNEIIRRSIGFDGLLMTDDLSMKALGGTIHARTAAALAAGCDVVLHCNAKRGEMEQVAAAARPLDERGLRRYLGAVAAIRAPEPFDIEAARAELAGLLGDDSGV